MSADNGIYILCTKSHRDWSKDGTSAKNLFKDSRLYWRVAHAQAMDNLDWYKKNQPYNLGAYMYDIWGKSPRYHTYDIACEQAMRMHNEWEYTEYGIVDIDMKDYVFYGDG